MWISDKKHTVLLGLLVITTVLAWLCFAFFDEKVAAIFSNVPVSDEFWNGRWILAFRQLGKVWATVWLLMLYSWMRGKGRPAITALVALIVTLVIVGPLKETVDRPRPEEVINCPQGPWSKQSFPSGDTASAFAVATVLAGFFAWPWMAVLFGIALAVGLLRIPPLSHWPSDVMAGAAIGIISGYLAPIIIERHIKLDWDKLEKQWRIIAVVFTFALIPLAGIGEHENSLWLFIKTYGLFVAAACLLWKCRHYLPFGSHNLLAKRVKNPSK